MAEPSKARRTEGRNLLFWGLVLAAVLTLALLQLRHPDLKAFPATWVLPVTSGVDDCAAVMRRLSLSVLAAWCARAWLGRAVPQAGCSAPPHGWEVSAAAGSVWPAPHAQWTQ